MPLLDQIQKDMVAAMKAIPAEDPLFGRGAIRPDGRKIHPAYLFQPIAFIVLMLLVAWFAYSFGEAFSTVDAVLAGTLGVFATIGKVTSFARGAGAVEK